MSRVQLVHDRFRRAARLLGGLAACLAFWSVQPLAQSGKPTTGGDVASSSKRVTPEIGRRQRLAAVKRIGYQLRRLNLAAIAASPLDLVIIDHAIAAQRRFAYQFSPEAVQSLKIKPDGARRIVLAYLSIGEAERYRFYWQPEWLEPEKRPAWLGDVNPQWEGNYIVRFWHPEWQHFIVGGPDSYLARVMAQGFDGIYIDRADVHSELAAENKKAESEMVRFVSRIASTARKTDPNFLIVMQNAEELLRHRPVLDAIDAIAKEDLFYGIDHTQTPNPPGTVAEVLKNLKIATRAGRPVFVIEYLDEPTVVGETRRRIEAERFVGHFTRRDLGDLVVVEPDQRPPSAAPLR